MTNRKFASRMALAAMALLGFGLLGVPGFAQSAGTGALSGTVLDISGAAVPDAKITVTNKATGEKRTVYSGAAGLYRVPLLPPDSYDVQVEKAGFKIAVHTGVVVVVTQTTTLDIQLSVGEVTQTVTVTASAPLAQTESSSMGRNVNQNDINNLPLVARNFQEIIGLSPGISANLTDATQLGRGSIASNSTGLHSHGALATDDNFQMNGVDVNDLLNGGTAFVPVPNPDAIQEFKVQTGQYDAAYGRNAGANVQIVTKSGTNAFHGNLFEYFRNTVLDANGFFQNVSGQPRPVLNENQFGGTIGGPVKRDKLFFFGSYQGTRQIDGASDTCESSVVTPMFTNDRSALAIATLFNGQRGVIQNAIGQQTPFPVGPAVDASAPNGSPGPGPGPFGGSDTNPYNVNPVALALLNLKLPNGNYYIPNPQVTSGPFAGLSTFSNPCRFNEDQGVTSVDYLPTAKSRLSVKYFLADSNQTTYFNQNGIAGPSQILPGSPSTDDQRFQNASVAYSYAFNSRFMNEFRFGYGRYHDATLQQNPYTFSGVGMTAPDSLNDIPSIDIAGCCQLGGAGDETNIQNTITVNDSVSYIRGRHSFRFGGGITRYQLNIRNFRFEGMQEYLSWPDFLLGLNAVQNATAFLAPPGFSNAIVSIAIVGQNNRDWRAWNGDGYVQDDFRVTPNLTLNLGLRYEHLGNLADTGGRNANFYPSLANPNPPDSGTLAGDVVSSNFPGTPPSGVTQLGNEFGINGVEENKWEPRLGFAWQILPHSIGLVLRGGYGIYYSRTVGNAVFQLETNPPFSSFNVCAAQCNAGATEANPFPAAAFTPLSAFPVFQPYSPSTSQTILALAPDYRPPKTQQYSLGIQKAFARDYLLDITYVGAHSTELIVANGLNLALDATPTNPVRGQTSNTLANLPQRLPFIGFSGSALGIDQLQNSAWSWYNGLEASLTKRFSHGLQFLASYTFARDLNSEGANPDANSTGLDSAGPQNRQDQYGPALFERDQRFVLSFVYELPGPKGGKALKTRALAGWGVSSVMTFQTGGHLSVTTQSPNDAFGLTEEYAQLASGCSPKNLVNPGSVASKLTNYFNTNCIAPLPVIGADGMATGFGNSGVGSVLGPGQANIDFSLFKITKLSETLSLQFRASFFNLFNHPNFANPDTVVTDSNFGVITGTNVNPRIGQLALKLVF